MDNIERVKIMKRLYYYKRKALKTGDTGRANAVEQEIDNLRVRKHTKAYRRHVILHRKKYQAWDYKRRMKSGYFRRKNARYYARHKDQVNRDSRAWYRRLKQDPTRYQRFLARKRKQNRARTKVTTNAK